MQLNIEHDAPIGKSDHCTMHIGCKFKPVKCCSIDKYALSRGDYDGLRSSLQSLNWKELLSQYSDNIDDMWHEFKRQLEDSICEFIPKIKKFSQIKKACWTRPLDSIARAKIHKTHRLWSRYMETRDDKIFRLSLIHISEPTRPY